MNTDNRIWFFKLGLGIFTLFLCLASANVLAQDMKTEEKSLYDRLGGLIPISVVVSDFIDEMVPDPFLNQNPAIDAARKQVPAAYLKYQVTALVCQTTGGPCQYIGRSMVVSHAHLNISPAEWDRMIVIFKNVLAKHQVPEAEQQGLLDIVASTRADIVTAVLD
jgi:hemoglobin